MEPLTPGVLSLDRLVPVVVGARLRVGHPDRLSHNVFRQSVGRETDRLLSRQGAERSVVAGQRAQEPGVGVRFDQHVVGQPAATGERPQVGPRVEWVGYWRTKPPSTP